MSDHVEEEDKLEKTDDDGNDYNDDLYEESGGLPLHQTFLLDFSEDYLEFLEADKHLQNDYSKTVHLHVNHFSLLISC